MRTQVAVCDGGGSHGNAIAGMSIEGLWEPAVGAVVHLAEPNRDATVCSVRYALDPDGVLVAVVYLDDEETTEPAPTSGRRRTVGTSAAQRRID